MSAKKNIGMIAAGVIAVIVIVFAYASSNNSINQEAITKQDSLGSNIVAIFDE